VRWLKHGTSPSNQKNTSQLVDQSGSLADQPVTRSRQHLKVELGLALQFDKPHGWSRDSLGDAFGIPIVVLLGFHVRPSIFRCNKPNGVALGSHCPAQVMRSATRFHRHNAR
jgi:hypothetical protein